jgi:hypothetical protein
MESISSTRVTDKDASGLFTHQSSLRTQRAQTANLIVRTVGYGFMAGRASSLSIWDCVGRTTADTQRVRLGVGEHHHIGALSLVASARGNDSSLNCTNQKAPAITSVSYYTFDPSRKNGGHSV